MTTASDDTESSTPSSSSTFANVKASIRESFKASPYTACTRESMLWAIGTGTAMGLHRFRMNSPLRRVSNYAFGTMALVAVPSYYFCYRGKRQHDDMVKMLMKVNEFEHMSAAPEQPSADDDHPFLRKAQEGEEGLGKKYYAYHDEDKFDAAKPKGGNR